jgi:hypothetical protein
MLASEYERLAQEVKVRSPLDLLRFMFQTDGGERMTDRPETAAPTIREKWVADGSILDISFEQWCEQLDRLGASEPHRYGPTPVANCGADSWRDYYDGGYSPEDAWAEDGTYD